MTARRNDDDWIHDLAAVDTTLREEAVGDLRDMLMRGLAASLSKNRRVDEAFLDDIVQEASLKILDKLDTFEGRSKFRTWAVTIAVRTAVSQMRKREWKNVSLESVTSNSEFDPQLAIDPSESSADLATKAALLNTLKQLIDSELTEKQWTAITAELGGMPLTEVAEKLGSNPNALYKLLHDARKKLRRGLESAGFTIDDVRESLA